MNSKQIKDLQEVADMVPHASLRKDYSGRGMFGKTCLAITTRGSATEIIELAAEKKIRGAKMDNMGMGFVVYWPHISV